MRVICCYCKEHIRTTAETGSDTDGEISHGICQPCMKKHWAEKAKELRGRYRDTPGQ